MGTFVQGMEVNKLDVKPVCLGYERNSNGIQTKKEYYEDAIDFKFCSIATYSRFVQPGEQ